MHDTEIGGNFRDAKVKVKAYSINKWQVGNYNLLKISLLLLLSLQFENLKSFKQA